MMLRVVHLLLLMDMLIGRLLIGLLLRLLERARLAGHRVTGHLRPVLQRAAHSGRGGRQRHPAMVHHHVVQHFQKVKKKKQKKKNTTTKTVNEKTSQGPLGEALGFCMNHI